MADNDAPERTHIAICPRCGRANVGMNNCPNCYAMPDTSIEYVRADLAAPDAPDVISRGAAIKAINDALIDLGPSGSFKYEKGAAFNDGLTRAERIIESLPTIASPDAVGQARRETWKAAEAIAKERAQEYAARADTELAIGNQSNGDAWANWMKGAERIRQAIRAAALRAEGEKGESHE